MRLQGHQQQQQGKSPQQHQAQGHGSRRVVTVSHESLGPGHVPVSQPRYDFEASEPGELMMPLMPMHAGAPRQEQEPMYPPQQDPSPALQYPHERPEDPRFLPPQGPSHMDWYHGEPMVGMAPQQQPREVHGRRQMSGHIGHLMEMQAEQRYGGPEGRRPGQDGERLQGLQHTHLPPHLPPMPMPPGEPMYSDQSHFPQRFYGEPGRSHPKQFGMAPGMMPDYGRPHSHGYGMYGPPEQLPFPPQ